MIKIAICDNDERDLMMMGRQTEEYLAGHHKIDCRFVLFDRSEVLYESIKSGNDFNIFVLDIMMPVVDGIQIGRKIREHDDNAVIIYTTSYREYALSAFQNQAIRYLVKPFRKEEFFAALDLAILLLKNVPDRNHVIKCREGIVRVAGHEIVLVENKDRTALYTLRDGTSLRSVSLRGTFEDAVRTITDDPDFVRTHKSYFVNMRFIRSLHSSSLMLDTGREIPVSRRYYPLVSKSYIKFLQQ